MTTLTANIRATIQATYQSQLDLSTVEQALRYNKEIAFTDGAGANQAQKLFTDTRTLTASATENLDLAGGLTDGFGATLTFTEIKALIVFASASNTNNVVVGGAGSNTWVGPFSDASDKIALRPGSLCVLVAPDATGWAVTAGTGDILLMANSAGSTSVSYDIIVIGN